MEVKEKVKEGWNWLHNADKWHYFRNGRSLCGKWLCFGSHFEQGDEGKNTCKACVMKRIKEEAKKGKS